MFGLSKTSGSSDTKDHASAQGQPGQQINAAPGTQIGYSPGLVDALKSDHRKLLALYGEIDKAFKQGDYNRVSALLMS